MYDYVIVGAGITGATFARLATDAGKRCMVIDARDHVGGNVYDMPMDGIRVHKYGPHIFHTSNENVWSFVNKYILFNNYTHRPKVRFNNMIFSFPINLMTLYQLFGISSPKEARQRIEDEAEEIADPKNFEEWVVSQVGYTIYKTFYYGYSRKQWGMEPKDLPAFVAKRIPIRFNYDDNYFTDKYQGIPVNGYGELFLKLLEGIDVNLNTQFKTKDIPLWRKAGKRIIYTGQIDGFFDFNLGVLGYRSLNIDITKHDVEDYQGCAKINHPALAVPYTRTVEYKHFYFCKPETLHTYVSTEYPLGWQEGLVPYYPINTAENNALYQAYCLQNKEYPEVVFCGRLGAYKYLDMDTAINDAMLLAEKEVLRG